MGTRAGRIDFDGAPACVDSLLKVPGLEVACAEDTVRNVTPGIDLDRFLALCYGAPKVAPRPVVVGVGLPRQEFNHGGEFVDRLLDGIHLGGGP